jgi:hypothetical protein
VRKFSAAKVGESARGRQRAAQKWRTMLPTDILFVLPMERDRGRQRTRLRARG